jgi:L-tartrate/succinate antiporter
MGIITPFADAATPIYANSGYLPAKDYWRLGTIFGALFLIWFLTIGGPCASHLWGNNTIATGNLHGGITQNGK